MYRMWLLLSAVLLAAVLSLADCRHPAPGAVPRPSSNAAPVARR